MDWHSNVPDWNEDKEDTLSLFVADFKPYFEANADKKVSMFDDLNRLIKYVNFQQIMNGLTKFEYNAADRANSYDKAGGIYNNERLYLVKIISEYIQEAECSKSRQFWEKISEGLFLTTFAGIALYVAVFFVTNIRSSYDQKVLTSSALFNSANSDLDKSDYKDQKLALELVTTAEGEKPNIINPAKITLKVKTQKPAQLKLKVTYKQETLKSFEFIEVTTTNENDNLTILNLDTNITQVEIVN